MKRPKPTETVPADDEWAAWRVKRRLKALKKKVKDYQASKHPKPTVTVKSEEPATKPTKTYKEVKRATNKDGFPVVIIERSTDGKHLTVPALKFKRLARKGKITYFLPPPPKPLPKRFRKARSPKGYYAIQCGDDRVDIIYALNKNWNELICYHHRLQCTMHLQRSALHPKERVDKVIDFLQSLDRTEKAS